MELQIRSAFSSEITYRVLYKTDFSRLGEHYTPNINVFFIKLYIAQIFAECICDIQ